MLPKMKTQEKYTKQQLRRQLEKGLLGQVATPQLAEVIAHFVQLNHGARGLAEMMDDLYHAAKPGSLIQRGIMDTVLRSMWRLNEKETNTSDLGLLSDDDLERVWHDRLRIVYASETSPSAPTDGSGTAAAADGQEPEAEVGNVGQSGKPAGTATPKSPKRSPKRSRASRVSGTPARSGSGGESSPSAGTQSAAGCDGVRTGGTAEADGGDGTPAGGSDQVV